MGDVGKYCNKPTGTTNGILHGKLEMEERLLSGSNDNNNQPNCQKQPAMKRDINLLNASCVMIGVIIGSGIFICPVSIVSHTRSIGLSLIIWFLAGLLTIFLALCYTELGCMYPKAGGEYAFFKEFLPCGKLAAFLLVWVRFTIITPCFHAILALTTSQYLFKPFFSNCDLPYYAVKVFSVWVIVTVVMLNSVYVKYVTKVQVFLTAVKILALVVIIVAGILHMARDQYNIEPLKRPFEGSVWDAGEIAVALYSGVFAYIGWQWMFCLMEETRCPEKVIPKATVISISVVIVLYMLTNLCYMTVLNPVEMMTSDAVAVTFAERTIGWFSVCIPFLVVCSTVGAINGSLLGGSRTFYAAARDNIFPEMLSLIQIKYLTPWPSLWCTCLITVFYVVTGEALQLLEYITFVEGFISATAVFCVLSMRYSQPDKKRPVKLPLVIPVCCMVVVVGLLVLCLVQSPRQNGVGLLIILSGIPVYLVCVVWGNKSTTLTRFSDKFTARVQKLFLLTASSKED